jgi:hypothetical protein
MKAAKLKAKEGRRLGAQGRRGLSLTMFLDPLIGAFIASVSAAIGGCLRENDMAPTRRGGERVGLAPPYYSARDLMLHPFGARQRSRL